MSVTAVTECLIWCRPVNLFTVVPRAVTSSVAHQQSDGPRWFGMETAMSKTRPKADNNRELSDAELLGVSGGRDLLQALATGADALVKQRPRQPSEIWTSGSSSPPALILL